MKKILSIFTAMLCAIAVSADPVVLPATLDVSNVSFRSEGMPDFVIEEGQEYAGTYFDMGAHDSSNDTLLYAEWNVTIQPIKYNIAVDVYNTNGWTVQLYLLNQAGDTVKALRYKGSSGKSGQFAIGGLDLSDLEAGDYKVIARAATAWSAMKLKDVIFTADYKGVSVELPGTLQPAYAELSSGASVANNAIAFKPSTANNEYATWNVSFAEAGSYNVTIDMTATNGHTYGVALLSADGATEIGAVAEEQAWDTGVKELGAIEVPAAGNYKVKLTNATQWSEAVINSITFAAAPATPTLENGFYLVGSINGWAPAAEYHFVGNPDNNAEFMLNVTLAENDELKVVNVLNDEITAWFPGGDNYVVDAAHAGEKTVYFRPDYQGGEDWFGACIYIAPNAEPQPVEMTAIYDWAGEIGVTIPGASGVEISTVKIHNNADQIPAIKFGSSYVYADGKWLAIKPAEGGFKAGDVVSVAAVFSNDATDGSKYAQVDIYAADGATRLMRGEPVVNGKKTADDPVIETLVLEADQDSLFFGRYGNTGMFITLLKVERAAGDEPQPQECDWDAIDFLGDGSPEQSFGNQFKVCKAGDQPNVVNIQKPNFAAETGIYVTFPNAVFGEISLAEGQYVIEGAGMVLYLSAFTEEYTEVTINWDGNDIVFTVYNAKAVVPVEHTYTVAGGSDVAFGTAWDPSNTANDMVLVEGLYTWEKADLTLAAGSIGFKVCEDHAWTTAYPAQDYQLNIPEAGIYTITITFNADTKEVNAVATKTGSAVVLPTIAMHGNFLGSWADTENFTVAEGDATASLTLNLAAGNYEFGMRIGGSGNWTANGAAFNRENRSAVIEAGSGNLTLAADLEGDYVFTWTFETNTLSIAFPIGDGIDNTAVENKAIKRIVNGQLFIEMNGVLYNAQGTIVR